MNDSPPPKPKRRWYQYSLRSLLVGVLVLEGLAVLLGCFLILAEMSYTKWWRIAGPGLAGIAVIIVIILAIVRLVRHRFRYSLRTLLIFMVLCAIACSWFAVKTQRLRKQREAVRAIVGADGDVSYSYDNAKDFDPGWVASWLGYDPFSTVVDVTCTTNEGVGRLLEHSERFPDLSHLVLAGPGITDAALEGASGFDRFPRLTTATLLGTHITDAGLRHLAKWVNLHGLCINGCSRLTDAGMIHVKDMKQLEKLGLVSEGGETMAITDAGLAHIGKASQLKSLYVIRLPITDAGLAHLQDLTNLETLGFRDTRVGDAGLQHLADLRNLRRLSLNGTRITDAGLEHLKRLTNLEELYLQRTQVSAEGVEELERELPNCKIEY